MRERLRAMPDGEFLELVENSGLLVIIGFKEAQQSRGVSRFGEALVSRELTETIANEVIENYAESVVYRFKHIPAVAVRLINAEMAVQLRSLPWVDYVTTGSGNYDAGPTTSIKSLSSTSSMPALDLSSTARRLPGETSAGKRPGQHTEKYKPGFIIYAGSYGECEKYVGCYYKV